MDETGGYEYFGGVCGVPSPQNPGIIHCDKHKQPAKEGHIFLLTLWFLLLCDRLDELRPIRIRHQEHTKLVGLDVSYVLYWGNTHCLGSQNVTMFFILSLMK